MELELNIKELQKRPLFIATPMYGGKCDYAFVRGLISVTSWCQAHNIPYKVHFMANESLIQRARNYCTEEFMKSGCTHLLFIDSDIGFEWKDVMTLLHYADPLSDKEILAATYPKKIIAWEKVVKAVKAGFADENPEALQYFTCDYVVSPKHSKPFKISDLTEVHESGTGFMMIQRSALEKFSEAYPQYLYKPDHARQKGFDGSKKIMQYFHCEVINDRYFSEDYWFCYKAAQIGIPTWLAPWIELTHVGTYPFKGSMNAMAAINSAVNVDPKELKHNK